MEKRIEHSYFDIRGLRLHVAHVGNGESGTVVFLHGFPEIWYSWRHQVIALAKVGYRAIAPDFCGFGLSQQPSDPNNSSWEDLVSDLLAILDILSTPKAFIVAKDFGAKPAYDFALYHPERVAGVIALGVPFFTFSATSRLPKGAYILRWQEPGRAEADFDRFDVNTVLHNIYILFSKNEIPIADKHQEIMDLVDPSAPLPQWFTEEDLATYAGLYKASGFRFPIQIAYRTPVKGRDTDNPRIEAPVLVIMGGKDYFLKFPGIEEYISSDQKMKQFVPNTKIVFIPEGSHFVQEQFPDQINQLLIDFLKQHK